MLVAGLGQIAYRRAFVATLEIIEFAAATIKGAADASWFAPLAELLLETREDIRGKADRLRFSTMSDRICISTTSDTNEDFYSICTQVAGLSSRLLSASYPVRGAIVLGDVHHEEFVFGPALEAALALSRTNIEYPRVIFGSGITLGKQSSFFAPTDTDGLRYLDIFEYGFLADYWALHSFEASYKQLSRDLRDGEIKRIASQIAQANAVAKDELARRQGDWLLRFLNRSRET